MAKELGFAEAFCRPLAHRRNGHQATFANAAEFFNSLLGLGTAAYGSTNYYIKRFNLKCDIVPLGDSASMIGGVISGRLDAAVTGYPNLYSAVEQGKANLVINPDNPADRRNGFHPICCRW